MGTVEEIKQELKRILKYWESDAVDNELGGFVGRRNHANRLIGQSPKGSVLNARILWTFSASYTYTAEVEHLKLAERAFNYLKQYFYDEDYGGVYWTLNYDGTPLDTKKQIYAQAFAIYGLAEYYKVSRSAEALQLATNLFNDIEANSFDPLFGGYFEAFGRRWEELEDIRLSDKDANEKKTMNTHLHILEAYANLYLVWPNEHLADKIEHLLNCFETHIIHPKSKHLVLFMDELWNFKQHIYSYGHDIEASWLLLEAAEILGDEALIEKYKQYAIDLAEAASEGLGADGSLLYENNLDLQHFNREKHWWVQAEAMVGFYNAWQLTKDPTYHQKFENAWHFIQKHLIDEVNGEWFWGCDAQLKPLLNEDKLGLWKCPYHNVRACLEIIRRTGAA